MPPWLLGAYEAGRESGWTLARPHATGEPRDPARDARTRVTPRGEHRAHLKPGALSWMPKGSPRVWVSECEFCTAEQRGVLAPCPACNDTRERVTMRHLDPRWRRGELKHAQQRREREARAYELEMSEHALTLADVL